MTAALGALGPSVVCFAGRFVVVCDSLALGRSAFGSDDGRTGDCGEASASDVAPRLTFSLPFRSALSDLRSTATFAFAFLTGKPPGPGAEAG